jgi:hypothetical protein
MLGEQRVEKEGGGEKAMAGLHVKFWFVVANYI